jgi:hypothetical protein
MESRARVSVRRNEDTTNPFLTLHREMNRLFDDIAIIRTDDAAKTDRPTRVASRVS